MARISILAVIVGLLLLPVVAMSLMERFERKFVFFPTAAIELTPSDAGMEFEDVYFVTDDGIRLNGWYVPAPRPESDISGNTGNTNIDIDIDTPANSNEPGSANTREVTILWFHGNGGNIGHRVGDLALISRRLGVNSFIFDYRGYGRSEGKPTESGVYRDARAALDYLSSRSDVDPEGIVFFGRSLGTAVAVELAEEMAGEMAGESAGGTTPYGMILVSPLTTLKDMARVLHPLLPLHLLVGSRFNSLSRIGNVHCPLLVIHGENDEIIPVEQGRELFAAANSPKRFLSLPATGHNDSFSGSGAELWQFMDNFLASLPR